MLVGNKLLDEKIIFLLIQNIKRKKELHEISNDFVREQLFNYLQKESKVLKALAENFNPKSAFYKKAIKDVRAQLHRVYGLFRIEDQARQRKEWVQQLFHAPSSQKEELILKILSTNSSSKERLSFYRPLYQKLFSLTGKPKSILDLGCGINPFSFRLMNLKALKFYAYDLSEEEIDLLNTFFKWLHQQNKSFRGKAEILDLFPWIKLRELIHSDICFLFKMTDVLDRGRGHKVSEEVIKTVPAKYVVVSFPTLTMSGKRMNFPRRKWIELMCQRLGYKYQVLEFVNEIFYVIKKE